MTETIQQVKSPKNPPETIIDKTPKEPFISPLQKYINNYCEKCDFYKSRCRLDDQNGIARMRLCIILYNQETPQQALQKYEEMLNQLIEKGDAEIGYAQ